MSRLQLFWFYLVGFSHVFGQVIVLSVLILWGFQGLALLYEVSFDETAVLVHLILSLNFLAFFPGQNIWSYHLRDASGRWHNIVGTGPPPDAQKD